MEHMDHITGSGKAKEPCWAVCVTRWPGGMAYREAIEVLLQIS